MEVTPQECVDACKSVATWLENLPPGHMLLDPRDETTILVRNPHLTALALRVWLPAEGRA